MYSGKNLHFEISERKVLLRFFDLFFVLIFLVSISAITNFEYFRITTDNYYWTFLLALYIQFFATVFELYNLQTASNQVETIRSIFLTTGFVVICYLLTPFFSPPLPENRLQILVFTLSILFSLSLWRLIYVKFFASHRFVKKVLLVCDLDQLDELVDSLQEVDPHYMISGYYNTNAEIQTLVHNKIKSISTEQIRSFIFEEKISEIVIATQNPELITVDLYNQLIHLLEKGIEVREFTQVYEEMTYRIPVHYVERDFYRYFPFSRSNQNKLYLSTMRIFEIIIAFVGILIGIFVLPIILIGNFMGNKGPLFYKQERVGKNGKYFQIYKFRSMVKDAEANGAVFAMKNDMRVTKFGKFLRKTRIDEFPQFINILKGDMAVIGPRPERPFFVEEISKVMPFYETRHVIKPGLTGWAQVNYSYGESIEESLIKLQYDLFYIKHRSLFLDINIFIKTISTVLFYRGH